MTNKEKKEAVAKWMETDAYIDADNFINGKSDTILLDGHVTIWELKKLIEILEK